MSEKPTARDLIELPDHYIFKIFVKDLTNLDADRLLALAKETLDRDLGEPEISTRPSAKGSYHAHTLRIYIHTYEEIEQLYLSFQKPEEVVMVL